VRIRHCLEGGDCEGGRVSKHALPEFTDDYCKKRIEDKDDHVLEEVLKFRYIKAADAQDENI